MDFWCLQRMAAAAQGISKFRVSAWHVNKTIWIHFLIHSEFVTSSVLSKKYTSSFLVDNIKHVCVYFSLITDHCKKCCSHAWIQHWKLSIKQPIMFACIGAPYVCLCPENPQSIYDANWVQAVWAPFAKYFFSQTTTGKSISVFLFLGFQES